MAVTLCIPPRAGELCAPVRFLLRADSVVMELTARHRITGVEWDSGECAVAMTVDITDPETARPVDVRIDVVAVGTPRPDPRTQQICRIGERLSARKRRAAIVGVDNTRQGRRMDGETSRSLALEAVRGALADAGIELACVDGITSGALSTTLIYDLRLGPAWQGFGFGLGMITEAAAAI